MGRIRCINWSWKYPRISLPLCKMGWIRLLWIPLPSLSLSCWNSYAHSRTWTWIEVLKWQHLATHCSKTCRNWVRFSIRITGDCPLLQRIDWLVDCILLLIVSQSSSMVSSFELTLPRWSNNEISHYFCK